MWLRQYLCSLQYFSFLLTHPVWDVTQNVCHVFFYTSISTHTSRVGCDSRMQLGFSCIFISTHTSRVGCDRSDNTVQLFGKNFYSHIPCGMWLRRDPTWVSRIHISTHTSRVGCDTIPIYHIYQSNQFLLTHPVWDVTSRLPLLRQRLLISTHTSRVGCD